MLQHSILVPKKELSYFVREIKQTLAQAIAKTQSMDAQSLSTIQGRIVLPKTRAHRYASLCRRKN